MLVHSAEESFRKGMQALIEARYREALAFFEAALEIERRHAVERPQARYLSYYGLCLAALRERVHEAAQACRAATMLEGFDPDFHCNLGRVLLSAGRRREAHAALRAGLRLQPDHRELVRLLRAMGLRRRPVLPFLARTNPLNRVLGRFITT